MDWTQRLSFADPEVVAVPRHAPLHPVLARPPAESAVAAEIRLLKSQTRGKNARTLPIYGEMREWLEFQREDRDQNWPGCKWVFHYLGRRIGSHIKGWSRSCKEAGLKGLLFHDLRRSAVGNMERAGIPRKIAMEISGHRTESVYRRYDIVSPSGMKLAATKMEAYLTGRTQQPVLNPAPRKLQ